ncbi:hypothetical protein FGF1_03350 [Flavobacteriaceae bacterium GF1]
MSTIAIRIVTQPNDPAMVDFGDIRFQITHNGVTETLIETLSTTNGFERFLYLDRQGEQFGIDPQQSTSDALQASFYSFAFNRDHKNVFGNKNLSATISGNLVTITAKVGTFSNASYTGNAFYHVNFDIDNSVQEVPSTFSFVRTTVGGCSNIRYTAQAATGGTAPYRLELLGNNIFTGWDGNADINFNLDRGQLYSGNLYDSRNRVIDSVSIIVPRQLTVGDFKHDTIPNIGYSDLTVRVLNTVKGTSPVEYALEDALNNQTAWQQDTTFGGQLPGLYTLKIRDVYGCEISKQIQLFEFVDPNGTNDPIRYFRISEFNSLSFAEKLDYDFDIRKNHKNTLSYEEEVGIPYKSIFCFPPKANIRTQFKSSYDIHVCTLLRSDGSKLSLPLVQTQQNIGTTERVDCTLFTVDGGTGIYFEGGNQYLPNTNTINPENPTSPYNGGLPEWAKEGAFVALDGLGTFEISETDLFDTSRGVLYFKLDTNISSTNGMVQVRYNRHPYNLYRMDFNMNLVSFGAKVVIEAGWEIDGEARIERRFDSEQFEVLLDTRDYLKLTWESNVNFDDMVFSDGITCEMWLRGRLRPFSIGSSETAESDDRTRSLKQRFRLGQRLEVPLMTAKQFHKLGLASGIADDGIFTIQGLQMVVLEPPSEEALGDTNLYSVTAEYAYETESLAVRDDEIVLNPSTGIVGTSQTGKEPIPTVSNLRLLRLSDGRWFQDSGGRYVSL